jgi:hypothetical protein
MGVGVEGTVFELMPTRGTWTETILHNFAGGQSDGAQPLVLQESISQNPFIVIRRIAEKFSG